MRVQLLHPGLGLYVFLGGGGANTLVLARGDEVVVVDPKPAGSGPSILRNVEALTDRRRGHWAGHIVSDADRPRAVRPSDPIELLRVRLLEHGLVTEAEILDIHERVAGEVTDAVERAQAAVDAGDAELGMDDVFA